jgi:hypothetical protein
MWRIKMEKINIDEKFVNLAEKYNLDLEKISNEAIKGSLYPHLSTGEKICLDFDLYLQELEREQKCCYMNYKVESLTMKAIGKFDEFKVKNFQKYNVIAGLCGSGKSTIYKAITRFGSSRGSSGKSLLKYGHDEGEIILEESSNSKIRLKITENEDKCTGEYENPQSIILDDEAGIQLTTDKYREFLCYLRDLDLQIIMTARVVDDFSVFKEIFPDCNFIVLS